jgi:deoxyhypusine synthase
MGNIFASYVYKGEIKASTMKSGIEYMVWLANYYKDNSAVKALASSRLVAVLPAISRFA